MASRKFVFGEPVIYSKFKYSTCPGPRASDISPAPRGEAYEYRVNKFWRVAEQLDEGTVVVVTRRGKRHQVQCDDPNLRRPTLWERWRYAADFPGPALLAAATRMA
jgi:hypothetical protein